MKVAYLGMEALLRALPEPHRSANFKGGLGILAGDEMAGMPDVEGIEAVCFTPLYHRPWGNYDVVLSYDELGLVSEKMVVSANGDDYVVAVREIFQEEQRVYGIESASILDVLYTGSRRKRLLQEILFPKAVVAKLKALEFKPDIIWMQESHTALILALVRSDPCFAGTKILFTIHTPEQSGMERFYGEDWRFDMLGIDAARFAEYYNKDGMLDFTRAAMSLADQVNAVSKEHAVVTRKMFPEFFQKIAGITNGSDVYWMDAELRGLAARGAVNEKELLSIHSRTRMQACDLVRRLGGVALNPEKPIAWWPRRLQAYKALYPMLIESGVARAACTPRSTWVFTPSGWLEGLGMQIVVAGRAPETDSTCLWWMSECIRIARDELSGRFVYLPVYSEEIMQAASWGPDVLLVTPQPGREACGTSDQRCARNGIPSITTKTGGMMEYISEFDQNTGEGNGFFIEPYDPKVLYDKLRVFSNLWYTWHEKGDWRYPRLKLNAFNAGQTLDIRYTLQQYKKLFEKMVA